MSHSTENNVSHPTQSYVGLIVQNPSLTRDFYVKHLGFSVQIEMEAYVHLVHPPSQFELALLRQGEPNHLAQMQTGSQGNGLWIGLEVANADEDHQRLKTEGVTILQPPTDQPWGERTIVIQDPDGVVIYLGHKLTNN